MGTGEFQVNSYPSIESGITVKNVSFGAVFGRSSLDFSTKDLVGNYFWELKTAISTPTEFFNGYGVYGLLGYGGYFDGSRFFIEYGAGMSYGPNKIGYFAQWSNWDNYNYVSIGLSYSF